MSAGSCFDSQNERTTRIRAIRSRFVPCRRLSQPRGDARSSSGAGVSWAPAETTAVTRKGKRVSCRPRPLA